MSAFFKKRAKCKVWLMNFEDDIYEKECEEICVCKEKLIFSICLSKRLDNWVSSKSKVTLTIYQVEPKVHAGFSEP